MVWGAGCTDEPSRLAVAVNPEPAGVGAIKKTITVQEQLLRKMFKNNVIAKKRFMNNFFEKNAKRFRGGLVFKAHRLVCQSTLGWRVMEKKKKKC